MSEEETASSFFEVIYDGIFDFLSTGHPSVIHFPIIGILMGFGAGLTALTLGILYDMMTEKDWFTKERQKSVRNYMDRFEFTSYVLLILGFFGYIIAGITGILAAGSIDSSINNELLEFKVRMSIYVFFLTFTPIFLKTYFGIVYKKNIFNNKSRVIPLLYLLPLIPAAILTAIVAGAGGRYTYGHSILDSFGLSFLLPGPIP